MFLQNKISLYSIIFFLSLSFLSCRKEQVIPVQVDISYTIKDSNYTVPVSVDFTNKTTSAENYKWAFEGGEPSSSNKKNPGTIVFNTAGNHKITLEAWNEDDRQSKEIIIKIGNAVQVDFDTVVLINNFSPVTVKLTNKTEGTATFKWTFEGGNPTTYDGQNPPDVVFTSPGNHNITLEANNGFENFTITKTIPVAPPLAADFSIVPSFDDEDYEAPLIATLQNTTISGTTWQWSSNGGIINSPTERNTSIFFANPGQYTVTLNAGNGKSNQIINKIITVHPNKNLRTHVNVKFGINAAHAVIGSFYSTKLRKNFKQGDGIDTAGNWIDIAFFGINQNFTFNKFISPDSTDAYTFGIIPQAQKTKFVNSQEICNCGVNFTTADFDNMQNDLPLQGINVNPTQQGWQAFNNNILPRIILFQTEDGRKGAIKIKQFVNDGINSYILTDIKIQKNI